MKFEQWTRVVLPKVQGTWNLHYATLNQPEPLDFFFLFSSVGAMAGQWGQANYACGNTFLDAFVQYRHSLGLPCSAVNIGVIDDIGYLSENPEKLDTLRATATHTVQEKQLLDSIQLMLHRSQRQPMLGSGYVNRSQIGLGIRSTLPLSAANNRTVWRKDPRFSVYRNMENTEGTSGGSLGAEDIKQFLRDASSSMSFLKSSESAHFLAKEIGKTLFGFMMSTEEELDLNSSMASLGIDSLITIELRNWMRQKIGVELTVLEIIGASSVTHVGQVAQAKLVEKFSALGR